MDEILEIKNAFISEENKKFTELYQIVCNPNIIQLVCNQWLSKQNVFCCSVKPIEIGCA